MNILRNKIEPYVDNLPLNQTFNVFYQNDGAPAHNANIVSQFLNAVFEDRWIANNGPFLWPARSPDLTPLDFFFWGCIKERVFSIPPTTKADCQRRVRAAIRSLTPEQIRKATQEEVEKRLFKCLEVGGRQFEHLM